MIRDLGSLSLLLVTSLGLWTSLLHFSVFRQLTRNDPQKTGCLGLRADLLGKASFWLGAGDVLDLRVRQPSEIAGEQGPCRPSARWKGEPLLRQIKLNEKIKYSNNNNVEVMDLKIGSLQIAMCKHP